MTDPRWLSDQEGQAWRGLMIMQDSLSEFVERQLRHRFGMSSADYQVLAHLSESPGGRLRPYELGNLLRWDKSRLSQHLGRMQNRDLVKRERCPTDLRGAVITITRRGEDLIRTAAPQHVADVRDVIIDHLSPEELQTLITISEKVRRRRSALEEKTGKPEFEMTVATAATGMPEAKDTGVIKHQDKQ
jgi:DNA-binding MarR family transcriptional regulator